MKINVENIPAGSEPEIIIRCHETDETLMQLAASLRSAGRKLIGTADKQLHLIDPRDVFYFESVDSKVFIYLRDQVFESRLRLYEIEMDFEGGDFFRASKSTILNISRIESLEPVFDGRFRALLQNGETVHISRQYVPVLKKKLGL